MSKWCNVYILETVDEVITALRASGVHVDYTPDPDDPEEKSAFIERNGGVISSCVRWRRSSRNEWMKEVPEESMACLQLLDSAVNFGYLLHKTYDLFTVLKAPVYDMESLSSENPKPTLDEVIQLLQVRQFALQMFGSTAEGQRIFNAKLQELGEAIRAELGVSPEEAMELPGLTPLPPQAEQKFIELRDWLRQHSMVKW